MATRIQKVMPLLKQEEKNKNDYIPKVVSIGPYHHGKPELAPVEAFKPVAVNLFVSRSKDFYCSQLLEIIDEIRVCYEEESTVGYSDHQLAQMMLHDASFIIIFMEIATLDTEKFKYFTMSMHLGMLTLEIVVRDLFLLENQIPLRVIKLLMNLRHGEGEYNSLLHRYFNFSLFGERRQKGVLKMKFTRAEPVHLLEAFHRLLISDFVVKVEEQQPHTLRDGGSGMIMAAAALSIIKSCHPSIRCINRWLCCPRLKCFDIESGPLRTPKNENAMHYFRSVTDLKAKGIFFQPSPTRSLKGVDFKSHFCYATVQLPYWYISINTKVFFLNMVAYELSPDNPAQGEVTSYINFMKSLMERAEDVKELRENKILYNELGSDQEVLRVYKDVNTYGANNRDVFKQVKDKIQAHYSSKPKTWMAELIHTYFRTPWTVIGFLAAISLLAISAAQLHYAVHPK